ncbi:MAG: TolC family protein, partial [Saprospiraceae bacterium]
YPYWDQISDNIGYNVGFGLQIPIFNNRQTLSNVQRAKVATETAALDQTLKKQTLYFDISKAMADANAAAKSLESSDLSLKAQEASMKDQEKRFNVGTGNLFDLNAARSRFQLAQQNLLIAKYDYLFKRKVIDYYLGLALDIH